MDTLGKGMSHMPGGAEWDGMRLHHATQNAALFKTYELFISAIFQLPFWTVELKAREAKPWIRGHYYTKETQPVRL